MTDVPVAGLESAGSRSCYTDAVARDRLPAAELGSVLGCATAAVVWTALVPWDLSERSDGARAADDFAIEIAMVAATIAVLSVGLALVGRTRASAVAFAASGCVTWTALFAWRAGTADVDGANMFLVPLIVLCVPTTVVVPVLIHRLTRRLSAAPMRR